MEAYINPFKGLGLHSWQSIPIVHSREREPKPPTLSNVSTILCQDLE